MFIYDTSCSEYHLPSFDGNQKNLLVYTNSVIDYLVMLNTQTNIKLGQVTCQKLGGNYDGLKNMYSIRVFTFNFHNK